ncbi:MAG: LppX_LprAFG lipoprotein [Nocardioidaceae bacterium]|nr:LppX_LprAFG lipoprotein [Nocardioidaceae bacterium]
MRTSSRVATLMLSTALLTAVAGCQGGDSASSDETPQDRLAAAKKSFDDAEFIDFTLATKNLPDDIEGLLSAQGTGTHDPAFDGEVKVQTGFDVTAPLIAIESEVYVKLPFSDWSTLDPADYGAPDPAELMDPDGGISSLFTATKGLDAGDSSRDGDTVLTSIDGTIPGADVKAVFPSSGSDDFDVSYTLTDGNDIDSIDITGPFYDGSDDVTYSISLDLDGDEVDVVAPI